MKKKMTKMVAALAACAAVAFLSIDEVENQERQITGVIARTPSGLITVGSPIQNASVEYVEDGAAGSTALIATTDRNGRFSFTAGGSGIVTASKSGFATISVGWRSDTGALRIELPAPATLTGRTYDMASRRTILGAHVSVMVDHEVNPHSSAVLTDTGSFEFRGLPPGSAVLLVQARGYAPTVETTTLAGGRSRNVEVGMLLEGSVVGNVVNAQNNAVGGALIEVMYDGFADAGLLASGISGHIMTGDDGRFRVNGIVPDQRFSIYAELEDGSRSGSQSLTATPGIPIENVVLTIQ